MKMVNAVERKHAEIAYTELVKARRAVAAARCSIDRIVMVTDDEELITYYAPLRTKLSDMWDELYQVTRKVSERIHPDSEQVH